MNLKLEAVEELMKRRPLVAHWLNECELQYDSVQSDSWPTIHLIAPSAYFHESLKNPSVWPSIHKVLEEIIGRDFTLNFVLKQNGMK